MRTATKCVHIPEIRVENKPVTMPIFMTSTFECTPELFSEIIAQEIRNEGAYFEKSKKRFIYTRGSNPNQRALELALAELEGAEDAVSFSSGMGAIFQTFYALLKPGSRVLASKMLYGGTLDLLQDLRRFGIKIESVETWEEEKFKEAFEESKPDLIYIETPTNPLLDITSLELASELAEERSALLVVDNTFATPVLQNPIKFGANLVIHSATKYLSGHSDALAGVVAGERELVAKIRLRNFHAGNVLSPFAAWLVLRGIKTLHLRVFKQSENAMEIAMFLEKKGLMVYYPGLKSHRNHKIAKKQMRAFGGVLSFELPEGINPDEFLKRLKLFTPAVSLGGVESLAEAPALMSHFGKDLPKNLIRLSIGIEDVEDLKEDLEQALSQSETRGSSRFSKGQSHPGAKPLQHK